MGIDCDGLDSDLLQRLRVVRSGSLIAVDAFSRPAVSVYRFLAIVASRIACSVLRVANCVQRSACGELRAQRRSRFSTAVEDLISLPLVGSVWNSGSSCSKEKRLSPKAGGTGGNS